MAKITPRQASSSSSSSSSSSDDEPNNNNNNNNEEKGAQNETATKREESGDGSIPDNDKIRPVNGAPSEPAPESSDDSGSDSDSEAAKIVTPVSSKPMDRARAPEKPARSPSSSRRFWTEDDEIAILEAMAEYQSRHGPIKLAVGELKDFHESIVESLSVEVTTVQLYDKIRKLRRKYIDGQSGKYGAPHDKALYKLAKKVWGGGSGGGGKEGGLKFLKAALGAMGNVLAVETLKRVGREEAVGLERRFKKQKLAEMKHRLDEVELQKETIKLVMEGMVRLED